MRDTSLLQLALGSVPPSAVIRSEFDTKGRIIVRGKLVTRGKAKRADYILYYKPNIPLALIEAKDNTHSVGDGMQQGLDYAATLDIPFVFSSNGDGFVFHDRTGASGADRDEPRPRRLSVARRSVGALSRLEGPRRRRPSRSCFRTISTTAAARPRATIRSTPSTPAPWTWRHRAWPWLLTATTRNWCSCRR